LPLVPEGPSQRPIVAMDYNLYVRHSKGKEAPQQSAAFEERAYKAFRARSTSNMRANAFRYSLASISY
jgi:hypothetical protein